MSGGAKKIMGVVVGLTVVFSLLGATMSTIITSADNVADGVNTPTLVATLADLWWIPMALILVGYITTSSGGRKAIRGLRRSSRRR